MSKNLEKVVNDFLGDEFFMKIINFYKVMVNDLLLVEIEDTVEIYQNNTLVETIYI